jgi:hypothetical protein
MASQTPMEVEKAENDELALQMEELENDEICIIYDSTVEKPQPSDGALTIDLTEEFEGSSSNAQSIITDPAMINLSLRNKQ